MASRMFRKLAAIPWLGGAGRVTRWTLKLIPVLLLMDLGYLIGIWPDWDALSDGPAPRSRFILEYEKERHRHPGWPSLHWRPVAVGSIPRNMVRAVIVAEDARFYTHSGVDFEALKSAMEYNLSEKKIILGGSTISQQTVKNLFLDGSRTPLRKWFLAMFFGW